MISDRNELGEKYVMDWLTFVERYGVPVPLVTHSTTKVES